MGETKHDLRNCPAMRALESLTPGGSEFIDDIPRCVQTVRDSYSTPMRLLAAERRKSAALEEALRRSLDTLEEFTNILRRTLPATASLSKDVIADGRSLLSQSVSTPETK